MKAFPRNEAIVLYPTEECMPDPRPRAQASPIADAFEDAPAAYQTWLREHEPEFEDFDAERVSKLKDAIGDGSFRVNSKAVAEALLSRLGPALAARRAS